MVNSELTFHRRQRVLFHSFASMERNSFGTDRAFVRCGAEKTRNLTLGSARIRATTSVDPNSCVFLATLLQASDRPDRGARHFFSDRLGRMQELCRDRSGND